MLEVNTISRIQGDFPSVWLVADFPKNFHVQCVAVSTKLIRKQKWSWLVILPCPALPSHNLIGWSYWSMAVAERNWKRTFTKIVSKFWKILRAIRFLWKCFWQNSWKTKFWEGLSEFSESLKISRSLRKTLWTNSVKIFLAKLSSSSRWISGILSFFRVINYLLTACAMPWNTTPSVFTHGPRKLSPYFKTLVQVFYGRTLATDL